MRHKCAIIFTILQVVYWLHRFWKLNFHSDGLKKLRFIHVTSVHKSILFYLPLSYDSLSHQEGGRGQMEVVKLGCCQAEEGFLPQKPRLRLAKC